jgi:uncharacterized membrane protein SpoIIM required for sporulation
VEELVRTRRASWERLETLLKALRRRRQRLSPEDLVEIGALYRRATSDLAIARRDFPRRRVTAYLEQLVGRAHPAVYRREAATLAGFVRFFTSVFPRAFREAGPYTAAAFAAFAIPLVLAIVVTQLDPLAGRVILPPSEVVHKLEHGESWLTIEGSQRAVAASAIMANNVQVAFLAFSAGVLFGVGTVLILAWNGLNIGAVAGLAGVYGLGPTLAAFIAAHGGIELTVIFIAGGAGMRLGHALLAPGLLPRRVALAQSAGRAVRLLGGCVPLLVVAGVLEGFVSPSGLPLAVKVAIGGAATLLLYAYLLLAGRGTDASLRSA